MRDLFRVGKSDAVQTRNLRDPTTDGFRPGFIHCVSMLPQGERLLARAWPRRGGIGAVQKMRKFFQPLHVHRPATNNRHRANRPEWGIANIREILWCTENSGSPGDFSNEKPAVRSGRFVTKQGTLFHRMDTSGETDFFKDTRSIMPRFLRIRSVT